MSKIPYYEYFKMTGADGIPTPWINLSVANGSGYFTDGVRISTWGGAMGIIISSTSTLTVTFQYSHDGIAFITPTMQNQSEYSTLVKSDAGSLWKEINCLGAASWIRLAVSGGGQSGASSLILNRVEEH